MTLKLVMDRRWHKQIGTGCACAWLVVPILFQFGCTKPVPGWLYQTCSIGSVRGQKRPLLLPWVKPWVKSYTHDGGHSLTHGSSSIPRWSLYLFHSCQLVPKSGSTRQFVCLFVWGKTRKSILRSLSPIVREGWK